MCAFVVLTGQILMFSSAHLYPYQILWISGHVQSNFSASHPSNELSKGLNKCEQVSDRRGQTNSNGTASAPYGRQINSGA